MFQMIGMQNSFGLGMPMGGNLLQQAMGMAGGVGFGMSLGPQGVSMGFGAFGADRVGFSPDAMMGGVSNFMPPMMAGSGYGCPACGMGNGMGMVPGMMNPGMMGTQDPQQMMMMMMLMMMMMQLMQKNGMGMGGMNPMMGGMPGMMNPMMGGMGGMGSMMNPMMGGMGGMMNPMMGGMGGMGGMMNPMMQSPMGMMGMGMVPGMNPMMGGMQNQQQQMMMMMLLMMMMQLMQQNGMGMNPMMGGMPGMPGMPGGMPGMPGGGFPGMGVPPGMGYPGGGYGVPGGGYGVPGNGAPGNGAPPIGNTQVLPFNGQTVSPIDKGKYRVSSEFGPRWGRQHGGIDLAAPTGTPVKAVADGTVTRVANDPKGYGNWIEVKHKDGKTTRYAHLSSMNVRQGQQVGAGTVIGAVGSTGRSTGPHLHFEVRNANGQAVNPRHHFNF